MILHLLSDIIIVLLLLSLSALNPKLYIRSIYYSTLVDVTVDFQIPLIYKPGLNLQLTLHNMYILYLEMK